MIELESIFNNKKSVATKRFYYSGTSATLLQQIKVAAKKHDVQKIGGFRVNIMIRALDNSFRRTFNISIAAPSNVDELFNFHKIFRAEIDDFDNTLDDSENIYRVKIINHLSSGFDTRCVKFHSIRSHKDVVAAIKSRMQLVEEKIIDEGSDYVFAGQKIVEKTHRITIYKKSLDKKYMGMQSFTVKMPNYSSGEIIELFLGGKQ